MPLPAPPRTIQRARGLGRALVAAVLVPYFAATVAAALFCFASALCSRDFPVRITDRATGQHFYVDKHGQSRSYDTYRVSYVSEGDPTLPPQDREVAQSLYESVRPGDRRELRGLLWAYSMFDAEGGTGTWLSLGGSSAVWAVLLAVGMWRSAVGTRRRQRLVEHGIAVEGQVMERTGRRTLQIGFAAPGELLPGIRPVTTRAALAVGAPVTVLVDPDDPRQWVVYELSGFAVKG